MSSILDAVSKDAARSGTIPGASAGGPPPDQSGGGSGPGRYRSAALVVVLGVALGAAAARLFGGADPASDDLLTEKSSPARDAADKVEVARAAPEARRQARDPDSARPREAARRRNGKPSAATEPPPSPRPLVIPAPSAPSAAPPAAVPSVEAAGSATATPPAEAPAKAPAKAVAEAVKEPRGAQADSAEKAEKADSPETADQAERGGKTEVVAKVAEEPTKTTPAETAKAAEAVQDAEAAEAAASAGTSEDSEDPEAEAPSEPAVVVGKAVAPSAVPPVATQGKTPAPEVVEDAGDQEADASVAAPAGSVIAGEVAASPTTTLVDGGQEVDPAASEPVAQAEPAVEEVPYERPSGAPEVSILFVAWSRSPTNRMASMRVGEGSLSVVREGEYVEGLQVSAIHPEAVDFKWTGQKFRVPVRPF